MLKKIKCDTTVMFQNKVDIWSWHCLRCLGLNAVTIVWGKYFRVIFLWILMKKRKGWAHQLKTHDVLSNSIVLLPRKSYCTSHLRPLWDVAAAEKKNEEDLEISNENDSVQEEFMGGIWTKWGGIWIQI